jgi:hypothetical protein
MLQISEMPSEEYVVYREDYEDKNPQMLVIPQNNPHEIYVAHKKNMPIATQLFFGGLSIVGLYMVYRLLEKSQKR